MRTRKAVLILAILSLNSYCFSQKTENVKIGTQVWTTTNLNVTTFRNGDLIPEAESDSAWKAACLAGTPAWCNYKNNPANGKIYGKLYNWYAVHDSRGLAPKGWHVPTGEEWKTLVYDQSEGTEKDQNNFKSSTGWQKDLDNDDGHANGNNSSGLSLLPGGYRDYDGSFYRGGSYGFFWSASEYDGINAFYCAFPNVGFQRDYSNYPKGDGISVRCVKD